MASSTDTTLYDKVIRITYRYLGPATDRFITRQIQDHLHKAPQRIHEKDLEALIDWIKLAMGMLTGDKQLVGEYINELHQLTKQPADMGPANSVKS